MLRGVNDTAGDAQRLSEMLADVYCMVNLIVFNPHDGTQVCSERVCRGVCKGCYSLGCGGGRGGKRTGIIH